MRLECSVFFKEFFDQLAVGTLQVAFDHVVLEVVERSSLLYCTLSSAPAAGLGSAAKKIGEHYDDIRRGRAI